MFERARQRGLWDSWTGVVFMQYLDGEPDRGAAIEPVDRTTVERIDQERAVVEEDIDWGLQV